MYDFCRCGSGQVSRDYYDARGIFLFTGCPECYEIKARGYRPEVITDPGYETDEPIEED